MTGVPLQGMDGTPMTMPFRVRSISAQIEERWPTSGPSAEKVWPEHLGRTAARRPRPLGPVTRERRGGSGVALGERPPGAAGCRWCGGRQAALASERSRPRFGASWPSRVCSGQPAWPDRVASEVGSGRSCVRLVGGHTPLQVSLDGKPGEHEVPSWRARCPDGEASHRHRRPGETGRRRYRQSAHLRPRARTAGMTRQSAHALDRLRAFCRGRAFRYLTQLTRRNRAREGWPCEPTRPTRSSVLSRGDRVPGDIAMSACDARSRRAGWHRP